jgi:predicted AAA+ superfamily ATPase
LNKKSYSPSQFGKDAEFIIALYLLSKGWEVKLSKGSRGPADLMAKKDLILLYIQIKASSKLPRIKGAAITKLKSKSMNEGALPVVATLQPIFPIMNSVRNITNNDTINLSNKKKEKMNFKIYFYDLSDWSHMNL